MNDVAGEHGEDPDNESTLYEFQQAMAAISVREVVAPGILIANIAVFVVMVASGVSFIAPDAGVVLKWGANFGPLTLNGQWWRMVTCLFLHFGIVHLGMNMFVLWGLARMVERLVGRVGFIILYLVSGLAASMTSLVWNPLGISAGASGAVFGTAGALLGFVVLRRDTIPAEVRNQLLKNMVVFLVLNTMVGMSVSHIDSAAHIGGLVGGFVCGLILSQPVRADMVARRGRRNMATIVSSAILLAGAATTLPKAPPDVTAEMRQFSDVETQVYEKFNSLQTMAAAGVMGEDEYAERLGREVLSPWKATRERMEGLLNQKYVDKDYLSRLVKFMRCREESWELRIEGLQERDMSRIQLANDKSLEADELAREL